MKTVKMAIYKDLVTKVSISPEMKTKQKEYLKTGHLPIIDQGQEIIGGYSDDLSKEIKCELPVIVFGDHTKCVKLINYPFGAGADGIKILKPKSTVLPKYLFYATKYLTFKITDKGYARHYQQIEKKEINIPPIPEQERIVAKIEAAFSELDKAVETLQKTKQQLEAYKKAVLKEAFSFCSERVELKKVCLEITDGDHMPPPKSDQGIPFIMISNISNNKIVWAKTNYVSEEYYNSISEKRKPRRGDVLYTVTGSFGIPVLIDFDKKFCFQRHISLLRPNDSILQKFLFYAMQSPEVYSQASNRATGTAQKTVGLNVLRTIKIPFVDDIERQQKIVSMIDKRLSICFNVEVMVNTGCGYSEAIRQSILKQAFEVE